MQSFRAFEQAVTSKMGLQGSTDRETLGAAQPSGDVAGGSSEPRFVTGGPCCPRFQELQRMPGFVDQQADAMVSVWGTIDFAPLEEIVDR